MSYRKVAAHLTKAQSFQLNNAILYHSRFPFFVKHLVIRGRAKFIPHKEWPYPDFWNDYDAKAMKDYGISQSSKN